MIRDPSDGSVREVPQAEVGITTTKSNAGIPVSGLPTGSQKPKNIQRLEASRAWLKDYHARKAAAE